MSEPNAMPDAKQILTSAKSILLVDWSSPAVPRALVEAGFSVFSASPERYSIIELVSQPPEEEDANNVFPPGPSETDYLVFRRLTERPSHVDIVNVYRPENEHEAIVANHLIPLGAKVLWLQPSIGSATAQQLAGTHGFALVEGIDIATSAH